MPISRRNPLAWTGEGSWWWLVPLLAASLGIGALQAAPSLETARGFVFIGGPILLLAGLHARTEAFLHARARLLLLPYPISPSAHRQAAGRLHRRALWVTATIGLAGLLAAATARGWPRAAVVGLLFDWLWLVILAHPLEVSIAGVSAWLGRRYPEDSPIGRLQRQASGGWTSPEAAIHLYAPAVMLMLAAALAMPAQLLADRFVDGHPLPSLWPTAIVVPLVLALIVHAVARHLYDRHLFEAVPWLAEATRSLSGHDAPPPVPRWVTRWPAPVARIVLIQAFRLTPVPLLRLLVLMGMVALTIRSPGNPSAVAAVAAASLLWIVPMRRLLLAQPGYAVFLAPLPTGARGPRVLVRSILAIPLLLAAAIVIATHVAHEGSG